MLHCLQENFPEYPCDRTLGISIIVYSVPQHSEWLLPSNLQQWLTQHFVALSLFQFLMTSSEFTEHFSGLNKACYPVFDRKDFIQYSLGGSNCKFLGKNPQDYLF